MNTASIRKRICQQRNNLSIEAQRAASDALSVRFAQNRQVQQANRIGLYFSVAGEIATKPLIEHCWQQGKQVYLPVLHPFSQGHLLFLHYEQNDPLQPNRFKIPEPKLNIQKLINPNKLDLIVAPLVAFDSQGNRIGMGGGYYDRLFAYHNKPARLGVAHDCQHVEKLAVMAWDIPLNEILTPSKRWLFSAKA